MRAPHWCILSEIPHLGDSHDNIKYRAGQGHFTLDTMPYIFASCHRIPPMPICAYLYDDARRCFISPLHGRALPRSSRVPGAALLDGSSRQITMRAMARARAGHGVPRHRIAHSRCCYDIAGMGAITRSPPYPKCLMISSKFQNVSAEFLLMNTFPISTGIFTYNTAKREQYIIDGLDEQCST